MIIKQASSERSKKGKGVDTMVEDVIVTDRCVAVERDDGVFSDC